MDRKEYLRNWWKSNKGKIIRKRYAKSEKGKAYDRQWVKDNPEKVKAKLRKYYYSIKGTVNYLKKVEKRKFKFVNNEINVELINNVNKRDLFCVYCQKELKGIKNEYDHLNPFKPLSKFNMVKCCRECNRSKANANVFEWCNFLGYKPSNIVYELSQGIKTSTT